MSFFAGGSLLRFLRRAVFASLGLGLIAQASAALTAGDTVVADAGTNAATAGIVEVAANGDRTFITGNGVAGEGAAIDTPTFVVVSPGGTIFYIEELATATPHIVSVNPSTGFRTALAGAFTAPTGMAWDAATSALIVSDAGSSAATAAILSVDSSSGAQTVVSGNGVAGEGAAIDTPRFAVVSPDGTIYYLETAASGTAGHVIVVNPATGFRTALGATSVTAPTGMSWNPATSALTVSDAGTSAANAAILSVDATSGTPTVVSSQGVGSGSAIDTPASPIVGSTGTIYYYELQATGTANNVIRVVGGVRTVWSGSSGSVGAGTAFAAITSVGLVAPAQPTISPASLTGATAGTATNQTITIGSGTPPFTSLTVTAFSGGTTGLTSGALTPNAGAGTVALSGTPSAAGSATFTVNVTDTAGLTATKNYALTVNAALSISPASLSATTAGRSTTQVMTVSNGTTPYTGLTVTSFSAGGTGLSIPTISLGAGTATLSGTPSAAGTTTFTVNATDTAGATLTKNYSLTVNAVPSITTTTLPDWTINKSGYSQTLATTGGTGAKTFAVTSGSLPTGQSLDTNTGVVSGTPTAAATFNFTITVTDSVGATGSKAYTVIVNAVPSITTTTLPDWTINKSGYSQTLATTGGTGAKTFAVTSGSLPTGQSLDTNTGVVSGTPTVAATFNFSITVTDTPGATAAQAYTVIVNPAVSINTSTLPDWTINKSGYSQTIAVAGGTGAKTFAVTSGSLPTGLSLNTSTGVVSGTPTAAATFNFTITATDVPGATASQAYTVIVNPVVSINTSSLPNWTLNLSGYSQTIAVAGGTGAKTFAVSAGALPTGLSLDTSTGVVSGTPTTAATFNFTVTATDTVGATASQAYSITVNAALSISTATLPDWTIDVAYSRTIATAGGTGAKTFAVTSGSLPTGLSLNTSTGVVSGTPTATGTYNFTITATDNVGATGSQAYGVTVNSALSIAPTTLASAIIGIATNQTITISHGTTAYSIQVNSFAAGGTGLSTPSVSGNTVVVSGTSTAAGDATFTVDVTDAAGATLSQGYTLSSISGVPTHFAVSAPANATAGTPVSVTVTAQDVGNNTATTYAGTVHFTSTDSQAVLPADATLTNGVGTFNVTFKTSGARTVTAADAVNSLTGTSGSVTVGAAAATHFAVSAPGTATAGTAISVTVTAQDQFGNTDTSYACPVHFTSTDGQAVLPADSTLTSGVGVFSATLKTAGVKTVTATDTITPSITGVSGSITVGVGPVTHFAVTAPASGAAGTALSATVMAADVGGNTVTAYAGTVHFTSTDTHATLPADSSLTNGIGTFSVTFKTAGTQSVTATDTGAPLTGSASVNVAQGNASVVLTGLTATYNAAVQDVTVTTTPLGLATLVTYDGKPEVFTPVDGTLAAYAGGVGQTIYVLVIGATSGSVYGAGSYAINSNVAAAAVHAGVLTVGQTATLQIALAADAGPYTGSTAHGVTSLSEGAQAASFTIVGVATTGFSTGPLTAGSYAVVATILDANYTGNASGTLVIAKATPVITWADPAAIVYGTALSATQLNATANSTGTIAYTPALTTVLPAGSQTLSATFTTSDPTNYLSVTKQVTLAVSKATPVVTWSAPAAIPYGTLLDSTQLNATTGTPGVFVYTPASGTKLNAGAGQALSVTFTPTDAVNYASPVVAATTITVSKVASTITWSTPADIAYGTLLSGTQLNASANVPGTLVYTPASGTKLNAGAGQVLSVSFTPTDAVNYTTPAPATTTITVNKLASTITWSTPADIVYGTLLSGAQLKATANVAGTFVYTPASGTKLSGGANQTLSVAFTPTDAVNYAGATATVGLNVTKAPQTIAFDPLTGVVHTGVPLTLGAKASSSPTAPLTFTVSAGATLSNPTTTGVTLTVTGSTAVVVTANQAGDGNFASATTQLTVTPGAPAATTLTFDPIGAHATADGPFDLSAHSNSPAAIIFTVIVGKNTVVSLSGGKVTLVGAGTATIRASQPATIDFQAASAERTFTVTTAYSTTFGGSILVTGSSADEGTRSPLDTRLQAISSGSNFAASLSADKTKGLLLGYLATTNQGFVANLTPDAQGHYTVTTTTVGAGTPATLTITGIITPTSVSGTIQPLGITFGAPADPPAGPTAAIAGAYSSPNINGAVGATYSVVGTQGQVFVLTVTPTAVASGTGTVTSNGDFNVQTSQAVTVAGSVNVTNNTVTGTVSSVSGGTVAFSGASDVVNISKVLVNMSARGMVNPTSPLIVGFVVNGTVPKTVVLRGVGPGLAPFGLSFLARPQLTLYDSTGTMVASNATWGGSASLVTDFSQVGAFALSAASADAALTTTLAAGTYTIVISDALNDAGGTTLAEIYDASIDISETSQRLVNISSRGQVTPTTPLLGGFVVRGNTPKKVLIRAVGPGLTAFNVPGVLADPVLSVLDVSGNVVARNDDWGTGQPTSVSQTVASAADVTAADASTGAFALTAGSKDSALITTLAPGNYSAVVSGANNTSGAALVEVYELP